MNTTIPPYFKFDSGQFLAETMGYPAGAVGIYVRLMALYWEAGCTLPSREALKMKLGIKTKKDENHLDLILGEFFKGSKHPRLDLGLFELRKKSKEQSDRAKARWEKREKSEEPEKPIPEYGPDDF